MSSIPKLLGRENYNEWAFAVENFLVLEGLSKCIDAESTEVDTTLIGKAKVKLILMIDPSLY